MTSGQKLRHQIARLSMLKHMPKHGETDAKFVKVFASDLVMLTDVLGGLARRLDEEGVPAQSWSVSHPEREVTA